MIKKGVKKKFKVTAILGIPVLGGRIKRKTCVTLAEARQFEKQQFGHGNKMTEVIIKKSNGKTISHKATGFACLF